MKKRWTIGLVALFLAGCTGRTLSVPDDATGSTPAPLPPTPVASSPLSTASPEASASPEAAEATPSASGSPTVQAAAGKPLENTLTPLPNKDGVFPVITKKETVTMVTSGGEVVIEIYPEAAPNACKRFKELIEAGFYNDTPVSRVVKTPAPFVAQFGINWRAPHNTWEKKTFDDDPSYFMLERGTLAFAKAGLNSNSTQVFINYRDNSQPLADPSMNFTAFGKVVKGMEVVDNFTPVGEEGAGLDQFRLWTDGGNYLESLTVKPTMIEKMTVVNS